MIVIEIGLNAYNVDIVICLCDYEGTFKGFIQNHDLYILAHLREKVIDIFHKQ